MANVIDAIINLVNKPILELHDYYSAKNRANNMGDSLEEYIKDLFANSFDDSENERLENISKVFSYLGNNSNPPDAMLFNGDAIEVKKIENNNSALALNSSYPKNKLFSSSEMISEACRKAEKWAEKDIIYAVGVVAGKSLRHLCFVYGLDIAANQQTYKKIQKIIKTGIRDIPGVEFAETKELGRVNKVDPLGITYLRVRGMWGIENPWTVFNYVYKRDHNKKFNFMCIINQDKWMNFDNVNKLTELESIREGLEILDIKIKNPDNPSQLHNAKLIKFTI